MLAVQAVAANSLFQVMNFPVRTSEIPCFLASGISRQHPGIAPRFDARRRQNGRKFCKFPVIFPVLREFAHHDQPAAACSPFWQDLMRPGSGRPHHKSNEGSKRQLDLPP